MSRIAIHRKNMFTTIRQSLTEYDSEIVNVDLNCIFARSMLMGKVRTRLICLNTMSANINICCIIQYIIVSTFKYMYVET